MSQEQRRPSISAFFPAYNDGGTIGSLVVTTIRTLEELTDDYEVIVVENGSTDYTVEVLEELTHRFERFRYYSYREPLGYGGALRTGFAACTKDLIFYTDGDAQYDPREIKLLLPALSDDVDIVNGWKIDRNDPLHRKIIGRVYHHTVKFLFGFKTARCRLRLSPDPAACVRYDRPRIRQRHHLSGTGEKVTGCRVPLRRGAGPPLPSHLWAESVLQTFHGYGAPAFS